jgi:Rieske 2Fe-2S family protein
VHTMLVPEAPASDKAREHYRRSFELIDRGVFEAEDLFVATGAHRSLRSGATERVLFCALEEAAVRFHRQVERDLQEG